MNNNTNQNLRNQVNLLTRQKSYAWAKYYESLNRAHHLAVVQINTLTRTVSEPTLPEHIKKELSEMASQLKKEYECPICLDTISEGELEVSSCGHKYCKGCFKELLKASEPKCACCRRKF